MHNTKKYLKLFLFFSIKKYSYNREILYTFLPLQLLFFDMKGEENRENIMTSIS
jgi:hypothetical protein